MFRKLRPVAEPLAAGTKRASLPNSSGNPEAGTLSSGPRMASRKEQKEAAREARLAQEQAAAARAARMRRLGMIGGVVVVAVIIAVVAIVISSGGSKKTGLATGTKASATDNLVEAELQGIPQSGPTLGKSSAPVTIQYFGDLECPYCAELTVGDGGSGLPQLITGPVKQGKVKLVYKSFETASASTNNDRFIPQQVAALAAGKQDLFWQYTELFYHEQGDETTRYVTESYLEGLARQIPGLNFSKWMSARKDGAFSAEVTADEKLAQSDGLQGTPTLVVTGKKGSEMVPANSSGVESYASIMSTVKAVS
jgi:protein-disulfide isomerase